MSQYAAVPLQMVLLALLLFKFWL